MNFLVWHFRYGIGSALNIWHSITILTYDLFSIPILLKTLFAPWKKDITAPTDASLPAWFSAQIANLFARAIGFTVRSITIIVGLLATSAVGLAGLILYLLFLVSPLVLPLLIFALLFLTISSESKIFYLIFLVIFFLVALVLFLIFKESAKNPPPPFALSELVLKVQNREITDFSPFLDYEARQVLARSKDWNSFKKNLIVLPEILFILKKAAIDYKTFLAIEPPLKPEYSPINIFELALSAALDENHQRVFASDLLLGWLKVDVKAQNLLRKHNLTLEDMFNIAFFKDQYFLKEEFPLLHPERLKSTGGIGKYWAAGYTPLLDLTSIDLTAAIAHYPNFLHFQAHNETISQIEEILARSGHHNVILVGPTGVGKHTAILGFAKKVLFGESLRPLNFKKVEELDLNRLIGLSETKDLLEKNLIQVLTEGLESGNTILVIDQIERIFSEEGKLGQFEASDILIPFLERSDFQLIATTNFDDYHKFIESNNALNSLLEKIEVKELDPKKTLRILEEVSPALEAKQRILITYPALKEVVNLAGRYLTGRYYPQLAIDLLDETMVYAASKTKDKVLLPEHVDDVISAKTQIPTGQIKETEKEVLVNLEKYLHQRLINQNEGVSEIAQSLRRARAGVTALNRPIGVFLFLGPTGVGKTETAKALASTYFGNEKMIVRFDMSQFIDPGSAERLTHLLTNAIKEKPFSIVLLDEIEKADKEILNLLLSVLDEGKLRDLKGEMTNFINTIIIATSNAGAEMIRQRVKGNLTLLDWKNELLDKLQSQGIFQPEFINRFDAVVIFRPLTEQELVAVVDIKIQKLNQRLSEKQVNVQLANGAKLKLARLGFEPQYGARALVRVLQDRVENLVADKILAGEIQTGQTFEITEEMI